MIAIKKVEVTPLEYNEGKIIDSFNTSDNKHVNTPSINAVEQELGKHYTKTESDTKYQPKVLSGTSEPSSSLGQNGDIYFQYSE